jgi:hypothetical protein
MTGDKSPHPSTVVFAEKPRPSELLSSYLGELTGKGDMPTGTQLGLEIRLSLPYCLPSNDGNGDGKSSRTLLRAVHT